MNMRLQKTLTIAGIAAASLGFASISHGAILEGYVGGLPEAPAGSTIEYDNLNDYTVDGTGGWVFSSGVRVSFDPNPGSGGHGSGSVAGNHAAPYISNSNGALFGDPTVDGPNTTNYLWTGNNDDRLIIDLPGDQRFFGLLWGSVDDFNTIEFWSGLEEAPFAVFTGADVTALANGSQGADGTYYVNINSDKAFNRVVLYSSSFSFEFDNISFSAEPTLVPSQVSEPALLGLFGLGLAGLGLAAIRRRKA